MLSLPAWRLALGPRGGVHGVQVAQAAGGNEARRCAFEAVCVCVAHGGDIADVRVQRLHLPLS